jgi:hypothetical protein
LTCFLKSIDFANVASATQALELLLIPSSISTSTSASLSVETFDMDVFDPKAPLKLSAEGMLADERKEEAETALGALGISNEKSPAREARIISLVTLLCQAPDARSHNVH